MIFTQVSYAESKYSRVLFLVLSHHFECAPGSWTPCACGQGPPLFCTAVIFPLEVFDALDETSLLGVKLSQLCYEIVNVVLWNAKCFIMFSLSCSNFHRNIVVKQCCFAQSRQLIFSMNQSFTGLLTKCSSADISRTIWGNRNRFQ